MTDQVVVVTVVQKHLDYLSESVWYGLVWYGMCMEMSDRMCTEIHDIMCGRNLTECV